MKKSFFVITGFVLFAALSRILPHPYNFAPIASMALFGGTYFATKKEAFLVPLAAMLLSDMILGFHETVFFVYGSFLAIIGLGLWIKENKNVGRILGATFAGSFLFFIVTNFGTWIMQDLYPKTAAGLAACYAAAIPFYQQTLLGDLFYVGVFFGGYEILLRVVPALRTQKTLIEA